MRLTNWTKRLIKPILLILLLLATLSGANASWWDDEWSHKEPIDIKNTAGELTDYQVSIELNRNNTNPNFNWSNQGDDLRFVDNFNSELNYWIEEWDSIEQKAVIWVKIPFLENNADNIIYMYYGNPSAVSRSNGETTFEFFEFFEDNDISDWNTTKWGSYSANAIADNEQMKLKVYKCSNIEAFKDIGDYSSDLAIKFRWKTKADSWYEIPRWEILANDTKVVRTVINGNDVVSPGYRGIKEGEVEVVAPVNGKVELLYRIYQSRYCNYGDHANTYLWIDDIRVRKYVSQEPSVEVVSGNTSSELPELEVLPEDIEFSGQPVLNEDLTITANVKNTGEINATNVTVQFFTDGLENGSLIGERVLALISSGGEAIANINWTLNGTGTHDLHIVVDPYNLVFEQNESNNEVSKPVVVSKCPLNAQQKLFQALNSGFAGHGYDFYEECYNYEDNATNRDPLKSCYTELEDDDIWINYLSSNSQGLYPCSAYLFGPKIGVDTNSWYDGKTSVRGLYYPELELDIIDDWIHNKPFVGENKDLENFLQYLLEVNKCGFKSEGVYSLSNIIYDGDKNRSMATTKFSGRFANLGGIVGGGDCQAEFNKYYDADTDQFGDNLKDLSCSVDLNIPSKEAGFGKNVSCSRGLIEFDGKVKAGAKLSPSASGGLRFGLEPQCMEPAGNIKAGIGLDAIAEGEICLASKCYDIESSLPIPEISKVEFVGEAVIPNEDFTSDDSLNSLYPNPEGGYIVYEDLDNLNPVFRIATSEIDVNYKLNVNLKEMGIPCGESFTSPPCNINLYDGLLFHIEPWQHYWGFTEVTVHSPVEIHLYDSAGRHVGLNGSGEIESQIPNSTYFEQNDTKTIRFPTETDKFTLLLKGTDNGSYTLDISRPIMVETEDGNATIKGINYGIENISTSRHKIDYYNIDFIQIERKINELVEQGLSTDTAVEKGSNLMLGVQNATKSPSLLYSKDIATHNGEKATLYAKLNSLNKSVDNKTVIFTLDGKRIGFNVTDSNGEATLKYFVPANAETGTHEIKCLFNGSESYYNSTAAAHLQVLNKKPQVNINVSDYPSGNVVINGSIIDSNVANVSLKIDDMVVSDSAPCLWNTSKYRNGYHRIELVANDSFGKKGNALTYVFVHNPIADAGGPYEGLEGDTIPINGSGSYDPYDEIVSWLWDLDGDATLEVNATEKEGKASHIWGDDYSGNISLQVTDSSGGVDTNSTRVIVKNVAPTVDSGNSKEIIAGDTAYFNGSFSDPGWLDEHTFSWSFGDGHSSADLNTTNTYYQKGFYDVNLTVEDDDGGKGKGTTNVIVKPITANVTIKPETLNLKSKGKLTAFIELPEKYKASKIDSGSIVCNNTTSKWVKVTDSDLIIAKFEREELNITAGDVVNLTIEGEVFHDGGYADFEGSDTINLKGEKERERHRITWRN